MDYRIVKKEAQKFLALVRPFSNEIINDESDHSIPDFWDECNQQHLLDPLYPLCPEGRRDLYGLCSPKTNENECFSYGIGILLNEDTDTSQLIAEHGYQIWETEPAEYVVLPCIGTDGDCISQAWSWFFKEFLPQSGYLQTEKTDYEIYFEKSAPPLFCELWIPVEKR